MTKVTIHRSSLTDIKTIPERCAIGFIEGGVANEENIETLQHFRENCDILISVGACAIWGGVPAMRNMVGLKRLPVGGLRQPRRLRFPVPSPSCRSTQRSPVLTTMVYPCHEVVKMDYFIPGCPPSADAIFKVFDDLINGRPVDLPVSLNQLRLIPRGLT